MCFLGMIYKNVPGYSVVVAANRDEVLDRPGLEPREIADGVWAGVDPRAGGTWLGVNRAGRIVGVANVEGDGPPNPDARSRGLLCVDLLTWSGDVELADVLERKLDEHAYNGFNLLVADARRAQVATLAGGELTTSDVAPGVHVIGNTRPDNMDDPKVARGHAILNKSDEIDEALRMAEAACRDHGARADGADAICVHGNRYGTLSSTLLAVGDGASSVYLYAEGNPCTAAYRDYSYLLRGDGWLPNTT